MPASCRPASLITPLDTWLVQEFSPLQRRHTIAKLVDLATTTPAPATPLGPTVAECDTKLARHRAALEAGADPPWSPDGSPKPKAERRHAEQRHHTRSAKPTNAIDLLSNEEIIAIVEGLGDIVSALREAEPEHKLEVYRNLGLCLTYDPETRTVRANIDLAAHRWAPVRVRGSTQTNAQRSASLSTTVALR